MNNQTQLTGAKKIFNTIATVFVLVILISALVTVWSNFLGIELLDHDSSIGLNYFIFDGWKNCARIAQEYNSGTAVFSVYFSFIVSLLAFVAAVTVVYIFGIKGIIKALKALTTRKDSDVVKYALIVSLTLFAYYNILRIFSFHAYGPELFVGEQYYYNYTSFGGELAGFFCWSGMVPLLAYQVIYKFDSKNISKSVRNIFIAISLIFIVGLLASISDSPFGVGYFSSGRWTFFDFIVMFLGVPLTVEARNFSIVAFIFALIAFVSLILLLIHLVKYFFFDKELNSKMYVGYMATAVAGSLLTLIVGNPMLPAMVESFNYAFGHTLLTSSSDLSTNFTIALFLLTFTITSVCLGQAKDDSDENKEEALENSENVIEEQ